MSEPQRTDGGSTEGAELVSIVSLELMAKELCSRRIQCVRMKHSNPEDFINESGPEANYDPQFEPQSITKTSPAILGKVRFLWSWTLSMGPGHLGEEMFHGHFLWSHGPPEILA
ncbi:hypothetical protein O181_015203 [Austropuccinia psidii MF-1]|uniref:Uncharacterized protein n=1 Tax=Austropuccinia psidii MF-1 TaxID=1389203 RepID=A0A9Q3C212_9BASI|nr:hypothetical protein [Austropuccinia psidii MF-1]